VKRPLVGAVDDLVRVLKGVRRREMEALEDEILRTRRVFVTGLGRTGLMMRGFAMRLMHLGRRVYHVGDVITPAIRRNDLLVIGTRTGRSKVLSHYVEIARRVRARVVVVTAVRDTAVARRADAVLAIDDRRASGRRRPAGAAALPLGSLFEQALLVVLDQVVVDLMDALGLTEADLARIHTAFE
jgi:6-phospho-3-hexuloisomerase